MSLENLVSYSTIASPIISLFSLLISLFILKSVHNITVTFNESIHLKNKKNIQKNKGNNNKQAGRDINENN